MDFDMTVLSQVFSLVERVVRMGLFTRETFLLMSG
jgi:hypothetical protein